MTAFHYLALIGKGNSENCVAQIVKDGAVAGVHSTRARAEHRSASISTQVDFTAMAATQREATSLTMFGCATVATSRQPAKDWDAGMRLESQFGRFLPARCHS